ncbi:CHAD domain-containing protein [Tardiphaga sp. P9-11]|uniref:CHAD domain-containing protein n=1 Tax=Tardiphaga sp. P9-11 TaxID=2024614 RepID=UPI0011F20410|nr:CHAD domain-containing protein [Tardiphaga sp. P9-11]KAA0073997.1 CHAD domain-containing protein [Tardiphaga sp. P9-11]
MGTGQDASHPLNSERGFQRIAYACLDSIRKNHHSARLGNAEGIHRLRMALTRLRAAQNFFSAMVEDEAWSDIKQEISWLNKILGAARNSDVTLAYARMQSATPLNQDRQRDVARQAADGHARVARALVSKRYRRLLAALRNWVGRGPWRSSKEAAVGKLRQASLESYASHRLKQWSHRLARWNKQVSATGRQHRIRILAKRFRYMIEALSDLGIVHSRKYQKEANAARQIQSALGDLRDMRRVRREIGTTGMPSFKKRRNKLLRKTRKALDRFS